MRSGAKSQLTDGLCNKSGQPVKKADQQVGLRSDCSKLQNIAGRCQALETTSTASARSAVRGVNGVVSGEIVWDFAKDGTLAMTEGLQ